jgi:hypothetical protein
MLKRDEIRSEKCTWQPIINLKIINMCLLKGKSAYKNIINTLKKRGCRLLQQENVFYQA